MTHVITFALQLLFASALGSALQLLFASLCKSIQKLADFESNLSSLKTTLKSTNTAFLHISRLDHAQPEAEAFLLQLIKGEELVRDCSNVKWSLFKRLYYTIKVKNLEASIFGFFQTDVAAFHFRELARMSEAVMNLEEKNNEIVTMMKQLMIITKEVHVIGCNCLRDELSDTVV